MENKNIEARKVKKMIKNAMIKEQLANNQYYDFLDEDTQKKLSKCISSSGYALTRDEMIKMHEESKRIKKILYQHC